MKRIDVGGKLLKPSQGNYFARIVTVLDETYAMNACKEDCCYVTQDFDEDVRLAKARSSSVARDYVSTRLLVYDGYMKSLEESKETTTRRRTKLSG